jgi:hypothetical protein
MKRLCSSVRKSLKRIPESYLWYVNLLVDDMPVHQHPVTSQQGTRNYLELLLSQNHPSISVAARALGEVLRDASVLGYHHRHPQADFLLDGEAGFVQQSINQYRTAKQTWGMQLNTCVHVVADRI